MLVNFTAQIYDLKTRATRSADNDTQIVLAQSNLSKEVLKALVELQSSNLNESRELTVVITDGENADTKRY